eukprot:CAMPEP_0172775012 /NCGR_PEP_ID=MMETSP1074-20121228/197231_1 /TAXON_ID=2916 /ORGANISM="Ceratium fusus, Strain PA161109" /LENGTH=37 /DNA_ID= /DNA_START= /DNA_END= /DNA_ORIENTATION=
MAALAGVSGFRGPYYGKKDILEKQQQQQTQQQQQQQK